MDHMRNTISVKYEYYSNYIFYSIMGLGLQATNFLDYKLTILGQPSKLLMFLNNIFVVKSLRYNIGENKFNENMIV